MGRTVKVLEISDRGRTRQICLDSHVQTSVVVHLRDVLRVYFSVFVGVDFCGIDVTKKRLKMSQKRSGYTRSNWCRALTYSGHRKNDIRTCNNGSTRYSHILNDLTQMFLYSTTAFCIFQECFLFVVYLGRAISGWPPGAGADI